MRPISRREAVRVAAANATLLGTALAAKGATERGVAPSKTFDIVFEGGGVKGAAFAGALKVLEDAGCQYRRLIGTSAGAIVATCLAAGYRPDRLREILTERDDDGGHPFRKFLRPPDEIPVPDSKDREPPSNFVERKAREAWEGAWNGFCSGVKKGCGLFKPFDKVSPKFSHEKMQDYVGNGLALLSIGAAASDDTFLNWMKKRLEEVKIDPEITLARFHEQSAARGIQLSLVATDLTGRKSLVLNHKTAGPVPVIWAVRMSMGIPLVWTEVEWQESWGPYNRTHRMRDELGGHRVVDGGVLSNFPLRYLRDPKHRAEDGVLGPFRDDVGARPLGLLLDETKPEEPPNASARRDRRKFSEKIAAYQSISRLIDTMTGAWDQDVLDELEARGEKIICKIPVKGYDTLDFDMEPERMGSLVESGRKAMDDYLKTLG
jgi:predicted acylesterase/phospholipase RssA